MPFYCIYSCPTSAHKHQDTAVGPRHSLPSLLCADNITFQS